MIPQNWLQALQGAQGNYKVIQKLRTMYFNSVRIILKQNFQPEILLSFNLASFTSFMVYNTIISHRPLQNIYFYLPKECKKKKGRKGGESRIREGKERERREKKLKGITAF